MSTDVTVGGQTYRVGRLDAMKQFTSPASWPR